MSSVIKYILKVTNYPFLLKFANNSKKDIANCDCIINHSVVEVLHGDCISVFGSFLSRQTCTVNSTTFHCNWKQSNIISKLECHWMIVPTSPHKGIVWFLGCMYQVPTELSLSECTWLLGTWHVGTCILGPTLDSASASGLAMWLTILSITDTADVIEPSGLRHNIWESFWTPVFASHFKSRDAKLQMWKTHNNC